MRIVFSKITYKNFKIHKIEKNPLSTTSALQKQNQCLCSQLLLVAYVRQL